VKVQGAHKVCLQLKNINSKADDEISQRGLFYINRYLTKFLLTLKFCVSDKNFTCLTPWRLGGFGNFPKKTAVFGCLTNALAPPLIALESCSTAQTDRPV